MSTKVFVGGLSWNTTDQSLHDAFQPFGNIVEAKVITDRDTGRSRGFGFVTFEEESSVQESIAALNGKEIDGRAVRLDVANDRPRRGNGGFGGGGGGRRY